LAYQPPASSTFLSEQISHQQPASSTLLSEQTSTSHQPPANRTGWEPAILIHRDAFIFFKAAMCNTSVCFEQAQMTLVLKEKNCHYKYNLHPIHDI
jgi:hypothetical protein